MYFCNKKRMETYEIKQSKDEVREAYSRLLNKLSEHINLLAGNNKPFTSMMGIKRALYRLRIDYLEREVLDIKKEEMLSEGLLKLTNEVQDKFGIDITDAIRIGLAGEKEIKKVLIKKKYALLAKEGTSYKEIKEKLSKEFGVSVSSIEKMVYAASPKSSPKERTLKMKSR